MKLVKYKKKVQKNNLVDIPKISSERNITQEKNKVLEPTQDSLPFYKIKWKLTLFIIAGVLLIGGGIFAIVYFLRPGKTGPVNLSSQSFPNDFNLTQAKYVFGSKFKIMSKEKTLNQLAQKSFQKYETTSNGQKTSYIIFNKAIYDIYTINSTSASEIDKDFYGTKYTTVITVNSLCSKITKDPLNDDCDLEKNMDLNQKEESQSNLRRNEENTEDILRRAILPICIVEHTDSNIIISLTCPETLSKSFKDDILRAFNNIKPVSSNGFDFDKEYVNTNVEEKEDKIYITAFDNVCSSLNNDQSKKMICNLTKDIITDKEGNLISNKISNATTTTKNENNLFYNNFTYEFKNIPKEESQSFNEEIYKANLDNVLTITEFLMKKEIYIENFTNFVINTMTKENDLEGDTNSDELTDLRGLKEESEEVKNPGVQEENILDLNIIDTNILLSLKNDIGFGERQSAKAISSHNVNNDDYKELSNYRIQTNLYETFNKFVSISKGANNMISKLYEDLNEPLLNFMDIINNNIQKIIELLANKDLSEIFDSTLAINDLDSLPYTFITATSNLYNSINQMGNDLLYTIDNAKKKLKSDISTFITDSHNLIFKLFNNLDELTELFSSTSNKIVEIQSYYLNDTDTSYYEFIQIAKDILDNYYKKEKNLIEPLVRENLDKFYKNTIDKLEKYQSQLDFISDKLDNRKIIISSATNEGYRNAIENIYNSKIKANEIIGTVKNKFLECLNFQSNGYFETQKELDENKQSMEPKSQKAMNMAYSLDNNELIDKTFDEVMIYFRDKFIEILKYMDDSLKQKFPLEENVLGSSLFDAEYLNEIDEYLKTEKISVLSFIKKENDNYLKSVNDIFDGFKNKNGENLDQLISELFNFMTDLSLDNLNKAYNISLYNTFKNIDAIINSNIKLGDTFFTQIQEAKSVHITNRFKNQYNNYNTSIIKIKNYLNKNLKNNLANKYKNVINQIRALLQSIKSNKILQNYYNHLPSAEKHLNSIKELFEIFNRHITDDAFNKKFLPKINEYIKSTIKSLETKEKEYKKIYNEMAKKESSELKFDYDKKRVVTGVRYCCRRFIWCIKHCRTEDKIYYDGYNVKATDNYEKLIYEISLEKYTKTFDNNYSNLYSKISEKIKAYNSLLTDLDSNIKSQKDNSIDTKTKYLENIEKKFKAIIQEKLGNNLLIASYNYFKNEITNKLPIELNGIKTQWENLYDKIYDDINTYKNKFKSSVYEFFLIGNYYQAEYSQTISYSYEELVVDKLKNEFNYTNKYYYNIITSKLKKTYSYILNNLPMNEKPFNDILNLRIKEIQQSQENLLKDLQKSESEILDKAKQEVILQVNSKNFFYVNDMVKSHINDFDLVINEKTKNFGMIAYEIQKDNSEELIAAKFYLENSINGKQIKENYEMINKANFLDLQSDVYQKLIDDTWNLDKDELIKNILNTLNKLNENNKNNFNYEYKQYNQILLNKLYEEFYTKDKLINEINSLYSKGLNNSDENIKNKIYNSFNSVLTKITTHLTNEASRLNKELTSYSNDFNDIKTRLNNYKKSIYNQYYSTITYAVNDFHEEIIKKFYNNYIEEGLKQYEKNIDETSFGTASFLNMSINLDEIINKEFKLYLTDYRNTTLNQIEYLYQKNIQSLDELFNFATIKKTINDVIDNEFNSKLLPILQKVATHNPGDEGVSNYDFSSNILNDISEYVTQQISLSKKLIKEMEGKGYIINNISPADFSAGKNNIYDQITKMFQNFTASFKSKEKKEFNEVVGENALNNFKNLINNFIPSFGVDFFSRILYFNQIQKIKSLYYNLQYSLQETIIYYISLSSNEGNEIHLPSNMKLKLYSLNNLDNVIFEKNNFIISNLNNKLDSYLEETKNYIINKYLNDMNTNSEFDLNFNEDLKAIIKGIINGNIHNYENDYTNMMKEKIKDPFIKQYVAMLNEATDNMKDFIEETKIPLKANFDNLFSFDSNTFLSQIQSKLNDTNNIIEEYNSYFNSFKISEEVIKFLDNFAEDLLIPKYLPIKELLDKRTQELIVNNLEKLSKEYRNEYSIETFQSGVNNININFTSYFDKFNGILKSYGIITDVYKNNLEKEIANNAGLRFLNEEINNDFKIPDVKLDSALNEIKNSSMFLKEFIQSLELFNIFEDNIKNYINEKNKQYSYTLYNLEKNKNDNYDLMVQRLEELNQLSSGYYSQIQETYINFKEQIINNINTINELVNSCQKVTFETISNKYIEIKKEFNAINDAQNAEKKKINIAPYKYEQTENYFTVETNVENYATNNKFNLELIFEGETNTPKIIGKLENKINPKTFKIDFYSGVGQSGKIGRKIDVNFKNISSYTNIVFDAGLNQVNIITNFNFDSYTIKTQYYEAREAKETKIKIGNTVFTIPGRPITVNIETPDDEKFREISEKNVTLIENYSY